jgi:hypothetical protein
MRNFLFRCIFIVLLLLATVVCFEVAYRVVFYLFPNFLVSNTGVLLDYSDVYRANGLGVGGYLKENFKGYVKNGYGGKVWWENDSQGFRYNTDISFGHSPNEIRVLSLGDSFTAGYRIGQNETFSSLLEQFLNSKKDGREYRVLISCIESPVKGLNYLSKFGIKYKPDVVLLGITLGNDILQSYTGLDSRGPFILDDLHREIRENPDYNPDILKKLGSLYIPEQCVTSPSGKRQINNADNVHLMDKLVSYRIISNFLKGYDGESIISYYGDKERVSLFDGCNGLGMFMKNEPGRIKEAYKRLFRILKMYNILSKKYNFRFIIIIFPQRFQVQKEDWVATKRDHHLKNECFDLMKPNNEIIKFCIKNDIVCIDPTKDMSDIYNNLHKSMYLPLGDMHMNALGNSALYSAIKDRVYAEISTKK